MTDRQAAQIIDDPAVKETYVNKLVSASFDGACVSLTFGVARVFPVGNPDAVSANLHVTTRLSLSPATAVDVAKSLGKMLQTLKEIADKRLNEQKPH